MLTLITGASSGIGQATAKLFALHGSDLILCGRRQDRLEALAQELGTKTKVHTLNFDVSHRQDVFKAIESLPASWQKIDILINNAGNAHGLAPCDQADLDDWEAMIDTNVKGLMYVSKAIIPLMVAQKKGHIIHVGSIAGKENYPNGNAYCASKAAVDALSVGMRMDLLPHHIKVSAIHPGLVETEFSLVRFKGDAQRAKQIYAGMQPLSADDIADALWFMASCPPHVNIADMLILPAAQASATLVRRENT